MLSFVCMRASSTVITSLSFKRNNFDNVYLAVSKNDESTVSNLRILFLLLFTIFMTDT